MQTTAALLTNSTRAAAALMPALEARCMASTSPRMTSRWSAWLENLPKQILQVLRRFRAGLQGAGRMHDLVQFEQGWHVAIRSA
jgi:hypothetical protein